MDCWLNSSAKLCCCLWNQSLAVQFPTVPLTKRVGLGILSKLQSSRTPPGEGNRKLLLCTLYCERIAMAEILLYSYAGVMLSYTCGSYSCTKREVLATNHFQHGFVELVEMGTVWLIARSPGTVFVPSLNDQHIWCNVVMPQWTGFWPIHQNWLDTVWLCHY